MIKLIKHELMFQEFLALKDVNLKVKRGEAWGLIGTIYEEYLLSTSIILAAFNEAFTLHCHFISESTKVYVKEYFNSFKKQ